LPVIRRKLDPNQVYSTNTRYNEETDTVQSFVNGDWVDNPLADPRTQNLFPPITTSDPTCDAAQSVSDAFEDQINGIITLISESNTFFTIAGALLALFEFGPWGVLIILAIAIAHVMLDAGATALTAAFVGDTWDKFKCILFCHMDTNGRVKAGEFGQIKDDVSTKIGGLAETILNAMLDLAGEAGVNNLAASRTVTGDCADCDCAPPCDLEAWTEWTALGSLGTIIDVTDDYIEVQSENAGAFGAQAAGIYNPSDCCTFDHSTSDGNNAGLNYYYSLCGHNPSDTGGNINNAFPPGDTSINMITIYGGTAVFTVKIYLVGDSP